MKFGFQDQILMKKERTNLEGAPNIQSFPMLILRYIGVGCNRQLQQISSHFYFWGKKGRFFENCFFIFFPANLMNYSATNRALFFFICPV